MSISNNQPDSVKNAKHGCRKVAVTTRETAMIQDKQKPDNMQAKSVIIKHIKERLPFVTGKKIAGYAAMRSELPLWDLLEILQKRGAVTALPIVVKQDAPLVFHAWQTGDELQAGAYGELTPSPDTQEIIPDIIFAPLLAFSKKGYRLGYGGGYYDRTLQKLRKNKCNVQYIGVAYSQQEMDNVPFDEHDVRLDGILTEQGLRYFG